MKMLKSMIAVLVLTIPLTSTAQDAVAFVLEVKGPVQYADDKGGSLKSLPSGVMLADKAYVITGKGGSASIVYRDNTTKKLGPEEELEVGSRTISTVESDQKLWNTKPKAAATRSLGGGNDSLFGTGALDIDIRIPVDSRVRAKKTTLRWDGGVNDAKFEVIITRNSNDKQVFKERTSDKQITVDLGSNKFDRDARYTWTVRDVEEPDDSIVTGNFYLVSAEEENAITRAANEVRNAGDDKTLGFVAEALHYQQAGFYCDAEVSMDDAIKLTDNNSPYKRLLELIYASQRD